MLHVKGEPNHTVVVNKLDSDYIINMQNKQKWTLILGSIIPIVLFTLIEDHWGLEAGLIAAIIYAIGEFIFEYWTSKTISKMTLYSNLLIIGLGIISLVFNDGIWFKLQPAIIELVIAFILFGSTLRKTPILLGMIQQQQGEISNPILKDFIISLNWKIAVFFVLQSIVATWAAFDWSTENWALLKGIGLPVSLIAYMIIEILFFRRKIKRDLL